MFTLTKKPFSAGILLFSALIVVLMPVSAGYAQQKHKGEWILPENYPLGGFDGWGTINRLATEEVVIDDVLYALSPSVTYHFPSASDVSASWFKPGHLVGFLKSATGEIISLWRIEN